MRFVRNKKLKKLEKVTGVTVTVLRLRLLKSGVSGDVDAKKKKYLTFC